MPGQRNITQLTGKVMLTKAEILAAYGAAGVSPCGKTNHEMTKEFLKMRNMTVVDKWEVENDYSPLKTDKIDTNNQTLRKRFIAGFYHRKEPILTQLDVVGCHALMFLTADKICVVHAYERNKDTLKLIPICGVLPSDLMDGQVFSVFDCHIILRNTPEVLGLRKKLSEGKFPCRTLESGLLTGILPKEFYFNEEGNLINFEFSIICNDFLMHNGITSVRAQSLKDFVKYTRFLSDINSIPYGGKYSFQVNVNPYMFEFNANLDFACKEVCNDLEVSQVSGRRFMFNEDLNYKKSVILKSKFTNER